MSSADVKENVVVDARGLACPMPVVKTAKAMRAMAPGQVLELMSTDLGSVKDVPAWAQGTGNELVATDESGGVFTFYLRKS